MKNLPYKIYLNLGDLTKEEYKELDFKDLAEITWSEDDVQGMNEEYIRKDAFIENACKWIETNMDDYIHVEYDTVTGKPSNEAHIAHKKVVEDFKKYMEGE